MSHIQGLSFALISRDDKGQYIAEMPLDNTTEISGTCGTMKPLWIYGKPRPGRCLALKPPSPFLESNGLIEFQTSFFSDDDEKILLFSTRDLNINKPVMLKANVDEISELTDRYDQSIKKAYLRKIFEITLKSAGKIYFIPEEKQFEPFDNDSDPGCEILKTLVLLVNDKGAKKLGYLDNFPADMINDQVDEAPIALTYSSCNTTATLWKIYPMVKQEAYLYNGVGG
ncbi:hypothetical protein [Dyella flagellata]|nr:hypothetical protein [Dyella flagellata]